MGLGFFLVDALQPAFEVFTVAGGVLVHVAVLGLAGHEVQQLGLGAFQGLVHGGQLGAQPLLDGPFPVQARPEAADVLPELLALRLALSDLGQHALVFRFQALTRFLQLGAFPEQALDFPAQVLQVVLQPVDRALEFVFLRFLRRDRFVLLRALQLDLFHGRVELLQLGGVLEVRVAQLLEQRFGFVDLAGEGLEVVQPQADVQLLGARLVLVEQLGLAGLAFEAFHLAFDFGDDVGHAQQVLVGHLDLAQGLGLVMLVAGHAGGFLDEIAALLGAGLGDDADVALLDDGIGLGAQTAAEEDVVNVLQAAGLLVQEIGALSGAV